MPEPSRETRVAPGSPPAGQAGFASGGELVDIVIATANPHKVAELRALMADLPLRVHALSDLPGHPFAEPEEAGTTFEENAGIKARVYALATGLPCLADDSGLCVDALGGAPGVISSHYASDGRETGMTRDERDRANNARLLRELEGVPMEQRGARFVCHMTLADPAGNELVSVRGAFEGRIGVPPEVPRGEQGFGYDPLFLVRLGYERTSAELAAAEKNALSHRAKAAEELKKRLRTLLAR